MAYGLLCGAFYCINILSEKGNYFWNIWWNDCNLRQGWGAKKAQGLLGPLLYAPTKGLLCKDQNIARIANAVYCHSKGRHQNEKTFQKKFGLLYGLMCSKIKRWLSEWVSEWQGHLLSCLPAAKNWFGILKTLRCGWCWHAGQWRGGSGSPTPAW